MKLIFACKVMLFLQNKVCYDFEKLSND